MKPHAARRLPSEFGVGPPSSMSRALWRRTSPVGMPATPTAAVVDALLGCGNNLTNPAIGLVPEVGALYLAAVAPVRGSGLYCRLAIASILDQISTGIRGPLDLRIAPRRWPGDIPVKTPAAAGCSCFGGAAC